MTVGVDRGPSPPPAVSAATYPTVGTVTIAEAHARLAASKFDVIVADYHLPDGHCSDLFNEVLDTPFILLTGTLEEIVENGEGFGSEFDGLCASPQALVGRVQRKGTEDYTFLVAHL